MRVWWRSKPRRARQDLCYTQYRGVRAACFEGVRCERQQARGGGPRWLNIFVFLAQVTTSRRAIGPAIASACCMCCGNRACIPISHCIDSARHPNTQPQPSHHGSLTDARGKLVLVLRTQHCRPAGLAHTRADTSPNCSGLPRRRLARFAMRAYDADQSYSISPRRATTTSGLATLQRQTFASCQHVSRQLTHCIELPRQSLARFAMRGYEHDHAHIAQPRHRHRLTGHGMSHARRRAGGTCTAKRDIDGCQWCATWTQDRGHRRGDVRTTCARAAAAAQGAGRNGRVQVRT